MNLFKSDIFGSGIFRAGIFKAGSSTIHTAPSDCFDAQAVEALPSRSRQASRTVAKPVVAGRTTAGVICREITEADMDGVADLLTRGFAGRSREYWMRGLLRQRCRAVPAGYPTHGCLLESGGMPVGVVLALFASDEKDGKAVVRCNLGGWYVDPAFRGHAPRLLWNVMKDERVTYLDVTPAIPTWPIVERLGFERYCGGVFFAVPSLSPAAPGMRVERVWAGSRNSCGLPAAEFEMLTRHADYGCTSLICHTADRDPLPFILTPLRIRRGRLPLPVMQLIYCRDLHDFNRTAGRIGRYLLGQGKPAVIIDANAAVDGLVGFYTERHGRKYFKGPHRPRLGDLSETELVLFGT